MNGFTWDDTAIEALRCLWNEGRSAAEISIHFCGAVSRNAVLGKLHRLGLVGRNNVSVRVKPKSQPQRLLVIFDPEYRRKEREEAARRQRERREARLAERLAKDPVPPQQIEPQPTARMAPLLELKTGECRFPFGDGPFLFCGLPATKSSYCDHCCSIVYQKRRSPDSVKSESSVDSGGSRKSSLIPAYF